MAKPISLKKMHHNILHTDGQAKRRIEAPALFTGPLASCFPANIVPSRHSLTKVAWQAHLTSLLSILLEMDYILQFGFASRWFCIHRSVCFPQPPRKYWNHGYLWPWLKAGLGIQNLEKLGSGFSFVPDQKKIVFIKKVLINQYHILIILIQIRFTSVGTGYLFWIRILYLRRSDQDL